MTANPSHSKRSRRHQVLPGSCSEGRRWIANVSIRLDPIRSISPCGLEPVEIGGTATAKVQSTGFC